MQEDSSHDAVSSGQAGIDHLENGIAGGVDAPRSILDQIQNASVSILYISGTK